MGTNYEKVKAWRLANPELVAEQARRYAKKHPETNRRAKAKYRAANIEFVRETDRLQQQARRRNDPERQRIRYARWRAKREQQLTDVAGRPRTVFDHCHVDGHFRGWLCDRCNRTLGQVRDNTVLLRKMIEYLERDSKLRG